ncbi:MAG: hypothetical protein IJ801_08550 [Lachnospiraceae bacterium]|nr:hypothetical protein [Lachnospiraceae bacterium]
MASINSIWGNTYTNNTSFLFNNTSSTSSTSSAGSNLLGIDLAEYSSITKGSYNKLIKAYYKKYGNDNKTASSSDETKDSTATKTTLKGESDSLYKAADALVTTGKNSLFNKVEQKDEESGTTRKDYDTDKIYKAVDSLVSSYNQLVKSSTKSTDNAVLRQTLGMIRSASSNGKLLNDIGIKINSDNTLSLDEETFKKADMSVVKSLFNGSGSFGDRIKTTASNINQNINNSLGNYNTYTAFGTSGQYSTGNLLDSIL